MPMRALLIPYGGRWLVTYQRGARHHERTFDTKEEAEAAIRRVLMGGEARRRRATGRARMAEGSDVVTLANGERWRRLEGTRGTWVGAGSHRDEYAPIHGDDTFDSYRRVIEAGVRRAGRARFRCPGTRGHGAQPHLHAHGHAQR